MLEMAILRYFWYALIKFENEEIRKPFLSSQKLRATKVKQRIKISKTCKLQNYKITSY